MPLMKCQKNKNKGFKFGKTGFCYTGKDSKEKALRQGKAIKISQLKNKMKKKTTLKQALKSCKGKKGKKWDACLKKKGFPKKK